MYVYIVYGSIFYSTYVCLFIYVSIYLSISFLSVIKCCPLLTSIDVPCLFNYYYEGSKNGDFIIPSFLPYLWLTNWLLTIIRKEILYRLCMLLLSLERAYKQSHPSSNEYTCWCLYLIFYIPFSTNCNQGFLRKELARLHSIYRFRQGSSIYIKIKVYKFDEK